MGSPLQDNYSSTFSRLLQYVKPYKLGFVLALVGMIGYASIDVLFINELETFIDEGLTQQKSSVLSAAPIFVIVVFILRGVFNYLSTYGLGWVGSNIVMNLRQELYSKLMALPVSFHDKESNGALISKITYDTEQIENACSKALMTLVREGAMVVGLLGIMFYQSWRLSIAIIFIVPLVAIIVSYVTKRFRVISKKIQTAMGSVTKQSEQMLSGHKVILAFGGQKQETESFFEVNNHNRQQRMKMVVTKTLSVSVIQVIASFALAAVLYLSSQPEMLKTLSPGAFTVILSSMMMLLRPLKLLTTVNSEFQRGLTAAQSVFEVLDEHSELNQGKTKKAKVEGHLTFSNVDFSYPGTDKKVISNFDVEIKPGSMVALVGRSGSGKTTISNFVPRFYFPDRGHITLDGVDINEYELGNLRSHIALVSQNVVLFNDTIAKNIAYGSPNATPEQIRTAAELAHVIEFTDQMEHGLQTEVGENGVLLSGGQRQRIAIARAILRNAPILIMDEATSALDTESERAIQDAMNHLMENRTSIVIAHRLSTIEGADTIIVMDQGKIIEQGSHLELLDKNGAYAALHQLQFGEDT